MAQLSFSPILINFFKIAVVMSSLIPPRSVGERLAISIGREEIGKVEGETADCNSIYHEPWLARKGSYDCVHHYENIPTKSRGLLPDSSRCMKIKFLNFLAKQKCSQLFLFILVWSHVKVCRKLLFFRQSYLTFKVKSMLKRSCINTITSINAGLWPA